MARRTSPQRRRTGKTTKVNASFGRRLRISLAILASVPVLILIIGVVGYSCVFSWLQGDGFRQFFIEKLRDTTGARQVYIPQNLTVEESSLLKLPRIEMKDMGIVSEMSVHDLHARPECSALWHRILRFSQFSSDELFITLQLGNSTASPKKKLRSANSRGKKTQTTTPNGVESKGRGFFKSIQMHNFTAYYADTNFRTPIGEFKLQGYKLAVASHPHPSQRVWNLKLENGRVTTPTSMLPQCGLKNAELLMGGEPLVLRSSRFLLSPGELYASGTYSRRSGLWTARLELRQADLEHLLSGKLKQSLLGSLNGDFSLSGQGETGEWEMSGKLWAENAAVSGLSLLSELRIPNRPNLKKIELQQASCNLKFPYCDPQHNIGEALLWDNIDIRAKGDILRLKGHIITGIDGSLSGSLRLGLPLSTLSSLGLPDSPLTEHLFSKESSAPNFVWITINLSGTINDPHEDLSARLSSLISQKSTEIKSRVNDAIRGLIFPIAPQQQPSEIPTPDENERRDEEKESSSQPQEVPIHSAKNIINSGLNLLL